MERHAERRFATTFEPELTVVVDRELARFGAWYEMFPRSATTEPGPTGRSPTSKRAFPRSPRWRSMCCTCRRSIRSARATEKVATTRRRPNQATREVRGPSARPRAATPAIHPELGNLEDFRHLVGAPGTHGLEIALDIAFQTAPDHPYATEHPEWFRRRPDGTIQYAENPPKKYQDIYPFDFETDAWRELWAELRGVFQFWLDQGIRIFRVDNPHTKPFAFWEWLIDDVKRDYPETIFLAEAFTRPNVLYRLAKIGFTQSYNYFPWRNTKEELTEYLTELTQTRRPRILRREPVAEHARHPAGVPPVRRAPGVRDPVPARGDARHELRDLRPGV